MNYFYTRVLHFYYKIKNLFRARYKKLVISQRLIIIAIETIDETKKEMVELVQMYYAKIIITDHLAIHISKPPRNIASLIYAFLNVLRRI